MEEKKNMEINEFKKLPSPRNAVTIAIKTIEMASKNIEKDQ